MLMTFFHYVVTFYNKNLEFCEFLSLGYDNKNLEFCEFFCHWVAITEQKLESFVTFLSLGCKIL